MAYAGYAGLKLVVVDGKIRLHGVRRLVNRRGCFDPRVHRQPRNQKRLEGMKMDEVWTLQTSPNFPSISQ